MSFASMALGVTLSHGERSLAESVIRDLAGRLNGLKVW